MVPAQLIGEAMSVYVIDALADERWPDLLRRHPRASVFHTQGWLKALRLTYGHKPLVLTTSSPNDLLKDGLVFCEVKSWITGRRLVSLPFSDHCDVLADSVLDSTELLAHLEKVLGPGNSYAEIRPVNDEELQPPPGWSRVERLYIHTLSLVLPLDELFRNLHKNCIQRKIRRAEREQLEYHSGRSNHLVMQFYKLLLRTRIRHRLPPQPFEWFRNLMECMGEGLTIRLAAKDGRPVAALLTLSYKNTTTYKYGCCDERFNSLGGMPYLLWKTIEEAKNQGSTCLDLGRSKESNPGLVTFKDRLGAERKTLTYWHSSAVASKRIHPAWLTKVADRFVPQLPPAVLSLPIRLFSAAGRLVYRHMD
jgi:hypothetical protein